MKPILSRLCNRLAHLTKLFPRAKAAALGLLCGALVGSHASAQQSEAEPNDSPLDATPLALSNTAFRGGHEVIRGSISAGDVDYFSFTAPSLLPPGASARVWIYVDTGGPQSSPSRNSALALFDTDLQLIEADDNDGTGNGLDRTVESLAASVISGAPLLAPGTTYYIALSNAIPGAVISSYLLFVTVEITGPGPVGPLPAMELEPNNTAAAALASGNVLIVSNQIPVTAMGSIGAAGDMDFYALNVGANCVLHIEADGNPGRTAVNTDLILNLYGPDGTISLLSAPVNSSTLADASATNPLAEAFAFEVTATGTYFLSVSSTAGAPFPRPYWLLFDSYNLGEFNFSQTAWSVREDAGLATITVTRNGGDFGAASVEYRAENGSATAGVDFNAVTGTLLFASGVTTQSFTVPILDDNLIEPNETVRLLLANATTGIGIGTATLFIYDNDEPADDTPATAALLDASAGLATASGRISPPGDVDYFAFDAPAGARVSLLTDLGGPRVPGDTGGALRITLLGTDGVTPLETDLGDGTATGFGVEPGFRSASAIAGRTLPVAGRYFVRLEGADPTVVADPYWFAVGLSTRTPVQEAEADPSETVPINIESWPVVVHSGNIDRPGDVDRYVLTVRRGSDIFLSVDGDPLGVGSNTDVRVEFSTPEGIVVTADSSRLNGASPANPSLAEAFFWRSTGDPLEGFYDGYSIVVSGQNTGRYDLIIHVRSAGEFKFAGTSLGPCELMYLAGEGSGIVTAAVVRALGNAGVATVRFATSNETAQAGSDYWPTNGLLVFTNGETRKLFTVRLLDDSVAEPVKSLRLYLSAPTGGAILAPTSGTVSGWIACGSSREGTPLYILDDDQPAHDTPATATFLDLNAPLVEARGSISPLTGHPEHWYSFVNPAPGTNTKAWIFVDTGGTVASPIQTRDSLLVLWRYNPVTGWTLIEQDDDSGLGNGGDAIVETGLSSAIAARTLPGPGTYYVQVLPFAYPSSGKNEPADLYALPVLDYRLFIALTPGGATLETEPNDAPAAANPLIGLATSMGLRAGRLSTTNDIDYYKVIASRNDLLFVSLSGNPERTATAHTDARILLIAPNGTNVLTADSSGSGSFESEPAESFTFEVPQTGTWWIAVRAGATASGTSNPYELLALLQSAPGPQLSVLAIDSPVAAGSSAGLQGQIAGAGPSDAFTLRLDWGDNSGLQTVSLAAGTSTFNVAHVYAAAGPTYPVTLLLNNETRGGSASYSGSVTVCLPRPSGLVAWWTGDGDARDTVGNHHGTLVGATFATGLVGTAFDLNGNGNLVRVGDVLDPGTNSFTIETWYRNTRWPDEGVCRIVSKGLTAAESRIRGYDIELYADHLRFQVGGAGGLGALATVDVAVPALGQFHHVAGVCDRATKRLRFYVDGALAGQSAQINLGVVDVNTYFSIGAQDYAPNTRDGQTAVHFFPGQIDEVAYYNRALSDTEVNAIYNARSAGRCKSTQVVHQYPVPPRLVTAPIPNGNQLAFSWPSLLSGAVMETTSSLTPPVVWTPVNVTPVVMNGQSQANIPMTNRSGLFRLRLP